MSAALAPAAVLRAAAWPLETLDAFGAPELLESQSERAGFRAYQQALERERERLWELTALSPRFMRALLVASPALFGRVRLAEGPRAVRTKRVRHLETSLYRYLVRAATRTTPNGLWAGVTSADFDAEPGLLRRAAKAHFSPDLSVFAQAFAALGRTAPYRDACVFRLNPSMTLAGDESVQFLARRADGEVEARAIAATPGLVPRLLRLAEHPAARLSVLAAEGNLSREALEQLLELGLLVGGLRLPLGFASPWTALEDAETALLAPERTLLSRARVRLRDVCAALGADFEGASFEALGLELEAARGAVHEFLVGIGHSELQRERVLQCDLELPCAVALGSAARDELANLLASYEGEWLLGESPFSRLRQARREALSRFLDAAPHGLGRALPDFAPAGEPSAVSEAWGRSFDAAQARVLLERRSRDPRLVRGASPWGTFLVRLGADGASAVLGVDDSPTRPYARQFDWLAHAAPIANWLRREFHAFEREHRVRVGELAVPFETNHNVLARPELGIFRLDPWGNEGPSLHDAKLRALGGGLVLDVPGSGALLALSLSAAHVLARDPLAAQLALTGFDESVAPSFRAAGGLHPDELRAPRHAPRLCLSNGVCLRARRTCLSGTLLSPLLAARRERAQPIWRELTERFGWERRLTVTLDGNPPLWLDASSPLGLEALLEGSSGANAFLVEEPLNDGYLELGDGRHLTDLAVPFRREDHAFSRKTADQNPEHGPHGGRVG